MTGRTLLTMALDALALVALKSRKSPARAGGVALLAASMVLSP